MEDFVPSVRSYEEVLNEVQIELTRKKGRKGNAQYLVRLNEAVMFLKSVYDGQVPVSRFMEAMSTSDFPILFGDILDRQLLDAYAETPTSWAQYINRGTVRDFRQARRIALDGLETPFFPQWRKAELENVKEDNDLTETPYTTQVEIYEKGFTFNWRMMVNDDLDAFRNLPQRLARGARRTEQRFASSLYQNSAGFNTTFFSNANRNIVNVTNGATSNNPPLSIQGLRDAFNVMYRQVDTGGDPIFVDGAVLVVPPTLQITATEILKAVNLEITPSGSSTTMFTGNWIGERLSVAVDWYAPIINTTSGHTTWYLFVAPNTGRPAAEITFLRGYEAPMLLQKAPNTQRVGGTVDPMLGDFEDMSWRYKGIHIIGGTLLDPKSAVVSNGTGV
jgi:hypothetical protein